MKFSTLAAVPLLAASSHARPTATATSSTDDGPTLQLNSDSAFNFQILIALDSAPSGGGDIGPVLGAAKNIRAGDMQSYSHEFWKLANHTKAQAEVAGAAYDPVNVRDMRFSAASYYRQADFYLHGNWSNPLINSLWKEQTELFDKAMAALPVPGERIRIPSKDGKFDVEAIWFGASGSKDHKRPTLIIGNGYDAGQEESFHYHVAPALARGWNCITYEGPGQPTVRRNKDIGFIPDWERVVTPVVDWVYAKKGHVVDKSQLVLLGDSFGGYLAARAMAFEPRISATILIDGVWDVYDAFTKQVPKHFLEMYEAGKYAEFDKEFLALRNAGKLPTNAAWGIDQGLWSFHTHSPSNFFNQTKEYRLKDVVDKIKVPVFIGDAEFDQFYLGQPKEVKAALGKRATLHEFTGVAGYHSQIGVSQELATVLFTWLNKTLRKSLEEKQ